MSLYQSPDSYKPNVANLTANQNKSDISPWIPDPEQDPGVFLSLGLVEPIFALEAPTRKLRRTGKLVLRKLMLARENDLMAASSITNIEMPAQIIGSVDVQHPAFDQSNPQENSGQSKSSCCNDCSLGVMRPVTFAL